MERKVLNFHCRKMDQSQDFVSEGIMDITSNYTKVDAGTTGEETVVESLGGGGDTGETTVGQDTLATNTENDDEEMSISAKKRKLAAPIWETAATKVGDKAKCNLCNEIFSCPDGSTTNVTNHVKKRHAGTEECKNLLKVIDSKHKENIKKNFGKEGPTKRE